METHPKSSSSPVRDAAVTAAKQAGAKGGIGVWATGGGREGLWISLRRPSR